MGVTPCESQENGVMALVRLESALTDVAAEAGVAGEGAGGDASTGLGGIANSWRDVGALDTANSRMSGVAKVLVGVACPGVV